MFKTCNIHFKQFFDPDGQYSLNYNYFCLDLILFIHDICFIHRVTHASPAGGYAHSANRGWESSAPDDCLDIAQQLVTQSPGIELDVQKKNRFFIRTKDFLML